MSCRFDPTGQNIAACSADRSVCTVVILLALLVYLDLYLYTSSSYALSFMEDIPANHELWSPPRITQSAYSRLTVVASFPPFIYRFGRPYICYHRSCVWTTCPKDTCS